MLSEASGHIKGIKRQGMFLIQTTVVGILIYIIHIISKVGEGRALYNLGNVFHAKGKHLGRLGQQDPGEFPEDVRNCLQTAVNYYE